MLTLINSYILLKVQDFEMIENLVRSSLIKNHKGFINDPILSHGNNGNSK